MVGGRLASTGLCLALEARKSSVAESPICSSSSRSESAIQKRPPRAAQLVRGQGRRVFSSGPAFRCNAETALVALRACHPAEGPSRRGERANDEKASSARRHRSSSPAATTTSMSAVSDLSTSLLERIRGLDAENASAEHRQLVITQLAQTLARDARDLRQDRKAVAETIFEDPFPLFDFLVPLLASEGVQSAIEDEDFPVKGWLCLIARQSSPREVIMAVEQHQATLRPSRIAAESDGDTIQETLRSFSAQHAALVEVVALATNRIDGGKRARFVESMCANTRAITLRLAHGGAYDEEFQRMDARAAEPIVVGTLRPILQVIRSTVATMQDIQPDDQRRKALASLRTLLFDTVSVFHRHISVDCAGELYRAKGVGPKQPALAPPELNRQLWQEIIDTYRLLESGPLLLMSTSIDSHHPPTYLGAFVLLVHLIASGNEHLDPEDLGLDARELFKQAVALRVTSRKDSTLELGSDAALFWHWWTVDDFLRYANSSGYSLRDVLTDILNWINPLAADSLDPRTRYLAFRLVARCLLYDEDGKSPLQDDQVQLELLTQLVVDCPDQRLQSAAVGLVKELILVKANASDAPSIFLEDGFFTTPLGKAVTAVSWRQQPRSRRSNSPALSDEGILSPSAEEADDPDCESFLQDHLSATMERLSLAFVLLSRATSRATAAPLLQEQLLDPLEKCLPEWSEYARRELDADAALEVDLVQNLLSRVRTIAVTPSGV